MRIRDREDTRITCTNCAEMLEICAATRHAISVGLERHWSPEHIARLFRQHRLHLGLARALRHRKEGGQ